MKKWVFISDLLFAFFITFLPALCLLRYLRLGLFVSIVVAFLIGVFFACLTGFFKRRKKEKLLLKTSEEKEKQLLMTHLTLLPTKDCLSLLYPEAEIKQLEGVWVAENEQIFLPMFKWKSVEEEDVLPLVRICLDKQKQCVILCDAISPAAAAFLSQFSILHLTGEDLYERLKKKGLPDTYLGKTYHEKKKKRLTRIWFSKSNSRRFFTGAILLFVSSFLVPFPYYYLVFGCLMALAAVLLRVFGYR